MRRLLPLLLVSVHSLTEVARHYNTVCRSAIMVAQCIGIGGRAVVVALPAFSAYGSSLESTHLNIYHMAPTYPPTSISYGSHHLSSVHPCTSISLFLQLLTYWTTGKLTFADWCPIYAVRGVGRSPFLRIWQYCKPFSF